MNRLNAKRIGVLAASLLFGLAVAGQVSFGNIQIINSAGQPVVQVVVGSTAQPSDGVVAANIAAVIGNLAFTSTPVTATVTGQSGLSCVVTTSTCSISNQQVWLGEAGVAAPAGTYGFTSLIGSVLNRGIVLGAPQAEKFLAATTTYGIPESYTTTNSPPDSPYTSSAAGAIPTSSGTTQSPVGASNGGGMSFSSFTSGKIDNLMVVSNQQVSGLLNNAGANGESEYLFLTGFPVYDQSTSPSVQNLAVLSAGGAYEVLFNHPIHQPYYTTAALAGGTGTSGTGTNTVNNAVFQMLGQNWTIVNYSLPGGTPTSATFATHGGALGIAQSLVTLSTVYVGKNLTSGPFTVQLADLGTATSAGVSPAAINVYYKGVLTNNTSIWPANTVKFNVSGNKIWIKVNATFAGLYAYQKYAKIQMYSGVYNLKDGSQFNMTVNQGWNVNLLWVNATATASTHFTDLAGIVIWNASPVTLTPGQSFIFIQKPQMWKVTFTGDTLGNNFDALTVQSTAVGSVQYANTPTGAGNANGGTGNGLGNINYITEPAQELIVTSQIPSAFNDGGFTGSTATYLMTPYTLTEYANVITANGPGLTTTAANTVNVVLTNVAGYPTANFITSSYPLVVTITGYTSNSASPTQATASFTFVSATTANSQTSTQSFFNITSIQLNKALPGIKVTVAQAGNVATPTFSAMNTMAQLTTSAVPQVLYGPISGQSFYSTVSGASVIYNQQNGQPTSTFSVTGAGPYLQSGATNGPWSYFTYNIAEVNVPSNTASTDAFTFNIVNATGGGVSASPLFNLNYSEKFTHNNVSYSSSQVITTFPANVVDAKVGFVSERGSKVAAIGPTQLTFDIAESVDQLQLVVGPVNVTPNTAKKTVGPYSIGQSTNLPNVTIANITAKCGGSVAAGVSGCTVSGTSNLTGVPSVTNATTPVLLRNITSTSPIAVLDTNAGASTLIVIGSKFVNTVAQQIFSQNPSLDSSFNPSSVIMQAYGSNRILVAGYYANQTVQAGNEFIQALLANA